MKNIAIVGFGGQGAWHAAWARRSNVISLSGVYDINPARMAAAKADGIYTYPSLDALLADKSIDIVVCATPNDSHLDIVISALKSGHHVVCEKPAALSVSDFDLMCEAAREADKLLSVHQNRRFDVDFLAIKSLIDSGEIGACVNLESRIHGSRGIPSDWRCHKASGGGMLLDWGVHLIDQMLLLIPERVKSVYCAMTHITTDEVDDGFTLHLEFESGKRATIEVGTYNFIAMPRFYMQATKGTALIEDWQKKCRVARLLAWCERDVTPVQTAAGITKTMAPRDEITIKSYELERPLSDVHNFYRDLCAAIDERREGMVKLSEVHRVLEVMQRAFESSSARSVISTNI